MKSNFSVDPEFPIIDGVGHSDKIGFFNVKGGGATNTTLFDCGYGGQHMFYCSRSEIALGTDARACRVGPDVLIAAGPVASAGSPDCLNVPFVGDSSFARGSDRILLNRIEVSGSVFRPHGESLDPFDVIGPAPKVFVCLLADLDPNGVALDAQKVFYPGGGVNAAMTNWTSNVPYVYTLTSATGNPVPESRFRVLAFDVLDFQFSPECTYTWVSNPSSVTTGGPLPVPEETIPDNSGYTFWRSASLGFRFDVDLNDCLCSFNSNAQSVSSCVDFALHLYAFTFDGINLNGYTPHAFGAVSIQYSSRLWFNDYLCATSFVPAGADGGAVPDEEVPLAILADQSGRMAGDGTFLDRPVKRSKAAHGFFNFRPRSGDAMLFEDDPEFARLQRRKGDSRSRVRDIVQRRFKSHKYDDNEDFNAREGDRGGKRGKY